MSNYGVHHELHGESHPPTQSVADFQRQQAQERADRHGSIQNEDQRRLREWHRLAPEMCESEARRLWDILFLPRRYRQPYYGPTPPSFEVEMMRRRPPQPVARPVESPLYWATMRGH